MFPPLVRTHNIGVQCVFFFKKLNLSTQIDRGRMKPKNIKQKSIIPYPKPILQCVIMVLFEGLTWLKEIFISPSSYNYVTAIKGYIVVRNVLTTLEKIILLLTFSKNGRYNLQVMWNLKLFMNHHWRWLLSSGGCKLPFIKPCFFFYCLF